MGTQTNLRVNKMAKLQSIMVNVGLDIGAELIDSQGILNEFSGDILTEHGTLRPAVVTTALRRLFAKRGVALAQSRVDTRMSDTEQTVVFKATLSRPLSERSIHLLMDQLATITGQQAIPWVLLSENNATLATGMAHHAKTPPPHDAPWYNFSAEHFMI